MNSHPAIGAPSLLTRSGVTRPTLWRPGRTLLTNAPCRCRSCCRPAPRLHPRRQSIILSEIISWRLRKDQYGTPGSRETSQVLIQARSGLASSHRHAHELDDCCLRRDQPIGRRTNIRTASGGNPGGPQPAIATGRSVVAQAPLPGLRLPRTRPRRGDLDPHPGHGGRGNPAPPPRRPARIAQADLDRSFVLDDVGLALTRQRRGVVSGRWM